MYLVADSLFWGGIRTHCTLVDYTLYIFNGFEAKEKEEKEEKKKKILSHGGKYDKLEKVFVCCLSSLRTSSCYIDVYVNASTNTQEGKDSCNYKCDGDINQQKKNIN